MLINLRNALMRGKRLPYDAEVEYLSSSENAGVGTMDVPPVYIDTGIALSSGIKMSVTAAFNSTAYQLMGCYGGSSGRFDIGINGSGVFVTSIGATSTRSTADTNIHEFVLDAPNAMAYIDGVGVATGTFSVAIPGNIILFSRGRGDRTPPLDYIVAYSKVNSKLYSCKIWDSGTLVRDYIPVRKGATGYLYDRVSGKLFGNAGTGDFAVGPDVVPVEYIESHGTEYIDTGLKGRDGYDFEYGFRPLSPLPCGIGGEYETDKNCYIGLVRNNGYLAYNYFMPNNIVEVQSLTLGTDYNVNAHLYSGEQYFEVNGVRGGTGSRTGVFTSSYNLYLFAINSANQPTAFGVMRLYNFTANLNTVPTRSFRPVRVGTEGAMMDTLTRRIYRNAGAGAFGYGNDLKYPIPA